MLVDAQKSRVSLQGYDLNLTFGDYARARFIPRQIRQAHTVMTVEVGGMYAAPTHPRFYGSQIPRY